MDQSLGLSPQTGSQFWCYPLFMLFIKKNTKLVNYLCLDCHPSLPTVKSSKLPKEIELVFNIHVSTKRAKHICFGETPHSCSTKSSKLKQKK